MPRFPSLRRRSLAFTAVGRRCSRATSTVIDMRRDTLAFAAYRPFIIDLIFGVLRIVAPEQRRTFTFLGNLPQRSRRAEAGRIVTAQRPASPVCKSQPKSLTNTEGLSQL